MKSNLTAHCNYCCGLHHIFTDEYTDKCIYRIHSITAEQHLDKVAGHMLIISHFVQSKQAICGGECKLSADSVHYITVNELIQYLFFWCNLFKVSDV